MCGVLFGVPLLLLQNGRRTRTRADAAPVVHHAHRCARRRTSTASNLPSHLVAYQRRHDDDHTAAPTTTTTAPRRPRPRPRRRTDDDHDDNTTAAAPTTTTTTRPRAARDEQRSGRGDVVLGGAAGYCASPTFPFGTVLTVTNNATGATTTCTVDDREAAGYPRVVDMSPVGLRADRRPGQGVVDVTISW